MSKDQRKTIRVGIIGANPERGWAVEGHIPALRSLSNDFVITALVSRMRCVFAAAAARMTAGAESRKSRR